MLFNIPIPKLRSGSPKLNSWQVEDWNVRNRMTLHDIFFLLFTTNELYNSQTGIRKKPVGGFWLVNKAVSHNFLLNEIIECAGDELSLGKDIKIFFIGDAHGKIYYVIISTEIIFLCILLYYYYYYKYCTIFWSDSIQLFKELTISQNYKNIVNYERYMVAQITKNSPNNFPNFSQNQISNISISSCDKVKKKTHCFWDGAFNFF